MLTTSKEILYQAFKNNYAVPAINTQGGTYDIIMTICKTAESRKSPIILAHYALTGQYSGDDWFMKVAHWCVSKVSVPVAIHLDHGDSFELVARCLKYGFTSIMYDGSSLPVEENAKNTNEIIKMCHAFGVPVEAEIGRLLPSSLEGGKTAANTAFMAGQGDVVGVWGPLLYDEDKKDLVMVSNDAWIKTGIVCNYMASTRGWENQKEAIEKWLEITIMAGEWAMENVQEAAEYMVAMNEEDGYTTTVEDSFKIIEDNPFVTLEENYGYYTQMTDEGDMLIAESQVYNPTTVFVEMGNFTEEQLDKILAGHNFLPDPIINIYNRVIGN